MDRAIAPFTISETLKSYAVPVVEWHRAHNNKYGGLVAAALVFDSQDRILLVRRAAHDFLPGYWEPPGGSVDDVLDQSILHACARELKEEASLTASRIERAVGQVTEFMIGEKLYRRLTFLVDMIEGEAVETDQQEHSEWKWASEDEVASEKMEDGRGMPLTFVDVKSSLMEGFRLQKSKTVQTNMVLD